MVHGRFTDNLKATLGVDHGVVTFQYSSSLRVRLLLWDIAGACLQGRNRCKKK